VVGQPKLATFADPTKPHLAEDGGCSNSFTRHRPMVRNGESPRGRTIKVECRAINGGGVIMQPKKRNTRFFVAAAVSGFVVIVLLTLAAGHNAEAAGWRWRSTCARETSQCIPGPLLTDEPGGTWYWLRSPDEEKRVVAGLYNRYCIRCHGVDGRGIWDIPDVPDFTNARWQSYRSNGQLARAILEGRGAVMPPFRGALSLEEAWAMARYLRTFVPGTEVSRPDYGPPAKTAPTQK
jgi:hypothetical protein